MYTLEIIEVLDSFALFTVQLVLYFVQCKLLDFPQ